MGIESCRQDFPLLERTFNGKPLIYLDSAATTQKPRSVIDAQSEFYRNINANVHRGVYALSEEATEAYERAREKVARFLHAKDPEEIVFVRGTTEAINLVASSLSHCYLKKGDRIVSTEMEHHSNIVPWHFLRKYHGMALDFMGLTDDGELERKDMDRLLTKGTKVTTLAHVSSVLGTVNPVSEIAQRAKDAGSLVVLDAAQSVPHMPIDVEKLGVDFLAFSGHKTFGPMGIGVLWGRKELLKKMDPFMGGGEMIMVVGKDDVTYKEPPFKFEAGTPNVAGAVTLGSAIDYVNGLGMDEIASHDKKMVSDAWKQLSQTFEGTIQLLGPPPEKGHVGMVTFSMGKMHPHDISCLLDADGVAIRSGSLCTQLVMKRYGLGSVIRASYALYNRPSDTKALVDSLKSAEELLTRTQRKQDAA
jgi:cysteine desulfurase/selenocysteine lyase